MSRVLTASPALDGLPQGWFHHGAKVLELIEAHRPKVCVELGTWKGASAIAMARVVRAWGGTVTCVDTWAGRVSQPVALETPPEPVMLAECAANLAAAGVSSSVRLIVASTLEAARYWDQPIDFLYIDADHEYASVLADLDAWLPHVRSGGLVAGDDYGNPLYPGVRQAWNFYEFDRGASWERFHTPNTTPAGMSLIYGVMP